MKRVLSLMILATSVLIAQPESNVPSNMSSQGLLTDTEGIAYDDGEYQLTFRLIREMNDGTEQTVWEENHLTNVTNGVFSVVLGSENPLPLNISPNVLLETQVGDEILSPRQTLTSVPFALKSSRSQQAYQSVLSDTANFAYNAQNATHADTANFVMNLPMVDSVQFSYNAYHSQLSDTAMVSLNAPMADTAQFAYNSQHATHSDSAMFTANSQHAVHADTAQFLINMPAIDSVMFAEQAHHSMYADTAQFVTQAQSALTSLTSENSTNSVYADTAIIVDLSQYNGNVNIDGSLEVTGVITNSVSSLQVLNDGEEISVNSNVIPVSNGSSGDITVSIESGSQNGQIISIFYANENDDKWIFISGENIAGDTENFELSSHMGRFRALLWYDSKWYLSLLGG